LRRFNRASSGVITKHLYSVKPIWEWE
jgi:hypothetical protein